MRLQWTAILGLVLATAAVYPGSLGGSFISDNNSWVTSNPTIRHLWPMAGPGSAMAREYRSAQVFGSGACAGPLRPICRGAPRPEPRGHI